jgi:peptidoglycan hydrolase CwlO-like protein
MEINLKDYISIAVTILTCGITIGVVKQTIRENTNDIKELGVRVKEVEKTHKVLTELGNDIKWMKESLNKIENKVDNRNCENKK